MPPPRPPRRHTHSRARSSGPVQQPNLALQRIAESLPPPKHKRSTDEIFSEPQRLHKVLASCGFRSRRAMEEMILAGRITVNRMPAEVGQKVGPGDEVRINGELKQSVDFSRLVRPAPRLLADVMDFMTLQPGDVLMLGCDLGRPLARTGDRIDISAPGFAALCNTLVAEEVAP